MSATSVQTTRSSYLRLAPLYTAQALATGATTVSTVLASLVMSGLGSENLAGLPSTLISAAAALSAGAFGALMLRSGRRVGLGLAFALGAAGAVVGFAGARADLVPVFLLGAVMMGGAQGGYQQARYAAAESVPIAARNGSWCADADERAGIVPDDGRVGAGGKHRRGLGVSAEVGGWLMGGLLLAGAAVLMAFWKPLAAPAAASASATVRLPLREALATPGVRSTALAVATAQGVMVTLMSLTPLRAHHQGMDHTGIAVLISGHILGMFGFGWLTGPLIDRFGLRLGYVGGSILLMAAALTAPLAGAGWLGVSMFLLGLGWNLAFVSAAPRP